MLSFINSLHNDVVQNFKLIILGNFFEPPWKLYIIIVWDVQTLNSYLNSQAKDFYFPTGQTYVILLVKNIRSDCGNLFANMALKNMLRRLWYEFGLLNVLLHTSCSCLTEHIMVYNPFVKSNGEHGRVELIHVSDAISYWIEVNSLMDFQQYPLRVSMFERSLTAMKEIPEHMQNDRLYNEVRKSGGYGGLDGIFVYEMGRYFNFNVTISSPKDGERFGYRNSNGVLTGTLGELVYQRTDFAGNSRFIMTYDSNNFHFTNPIDSDKVCLVVAKANKIPRYAITQ